jgi:putative oligomerization/nucleic acid binding protein
MPGLIRGVARTAVVAGTATAVSNRVSRRQARRWGYVDDQPSGGGGSDQGYYQEPPPPPPPPAAPAPDPISELKQLAALKDQGILTEEEFAAQKAKILGN